MILYNIILPFPLVSILTFSNFLLDFALCALSDCIGLCKTFIQDWNVDYENIRKTVKKYFIKQLMFVRSWIRFIIVTLSLVVSLTLQVPG